MKKVVGIFMAMVMVFVMIGTVYGEAKVDVKIDGAVYGISGSVVYDWIGEWAKSVGDGRTGSELKNGYYKGYGVIDAKWFIEEYGCDPTVENITNVLTDAYDLEKLEIVTAGFYDDYTVYKMFAKSKTMAIGNTYDYNLNDYVDYYEGDMYFMVVYED